jgi:hypothetical protein
MLLVLPVLSTGTEYIYTSSSPAFSFPTLSALATTKKKLLSFSFYARRKAKK